MVSRHPPWPRDRVWAETDYVKSLTSMRVDSWQLLLLIRRQPIVSSCPSDHSSLLMCKSVDIVSATDRFSWWKLSRTLPGKTNRTGEVVKHSALFQLSPSCRDLSFRLHDTVLITRLNVDWVKRVLLRSQSVIETLSFNLTFVTLVALSMKPL